MGMEPAPLATVPLGPEASNTLASNTEPLAQPLATPPPARKLRYGDEIEVVFERFDERGRARGKFGAYDVTVRHAVPGSRARVKVLRRKRDDVEGYVLQVLEHGASRVEPRCAHYPACGGCSLQDLAYDAQLAGKHALVTAAFRAHGLAERVDIAAVAPAREPWHYRNKMEFTFGNRRWIAPEEPQGAPASFALGLHAAELFSKVIDVRACSIQPVLADALVASARELALEHGLEPWDLRAHAGLLRFLAFRIARGTGEVLVNLVTASDAPERVPPYAAALVARHPEITTLVQNVNSRAGQTAFGEREHVLHGPGRIVERIDGVSFEISANSFFQTNSAQAELLFALVRDAARLTGQERVFDLYCGTGAIGLALARSAREVVGFEQVASAVADARRNAALNGFPHVSFVEGDVLASLAAWPATDTPDVCVVDPPRAGLHPNVPAKLAALAPARIVYVSCNPQSGARDTALLVAAGYELESVRPLDLFPHTPHVETVIALVRAGGNAP